MKAKIVKALKDDTWQQGNHELDAMECQPIARRVLVMMYVVSRFFLVSGVHLPYAVFPCPLPPEHTLPIRYR
jgi:hypothetical protein